MDRRIFVLAVFLLLVAAGASASGYQVVSVTERGVGPLTVTEEVVQVGGDPAARFTLHRMRKTHAASRGAMLIMPGGASNFTFYAADEDGQELQSFAAYPSRWP